MSDRKTWIAASALTFLSVLLPARAEILVGVSVSATGSGASLGVPIQKTIALLPREVGGEPVRYLIVDDGSDPSAGAKIVRRFGTEDHVDAIIGSSSVPVAGAQASAAQELEIPYLAICPISIDPARQTFIFAIPQPVPIMVQGVVEHMKVQGIRTVGFIGFADPWGELNYRAMSEAGARSGIRVVASERYGRADTSVAGQTLKILAARPDAVFIGAAGTPGVLPQLALRERGFTGPVYQTHGVVNQDFLRVGGRGVEGAIAPTGPLVVVEQLPADHPMKATGMAFIARYEAQYGAGTRNAFAGYAYDADLVLLAAMRGVQGQAKPGSPSYRQALRQAIESVHEIAGTHGVYTMGPADHYGTDQRARVMVQVASGQWQLVP